MLTIFATPVYRLPDMELIKKFAVPNEESALFVNDVAISEDGKWLVAVGDARDIWIYDVSGTVCLNFFEKKVLGQDC